MIKLRELRRELPDEMRCQTEGESIKPACLVNRAY